MARHSIPANLAALSSIRHLVTQACLEAELDECFNYRFLLNK
jgi:hypothetical protein